MNVPFDPGEGHRPGAPPIPPPSAYSCPNCGFEMNEAVPYCPRCGARLERGLRSPGCVSVAGAVVLVLLALPSALAGGCFLLYGVVEPGFSTIGIGLLGLGFAALCIRGAVLLTKGGRK